MSKSFAFKQFSVHHDRCAMKVGTDAILLGSWADSNRTPCEVLDIGTGTGIIALMMAQRFPSAVVSAVEVDGDAVAQAAQNFQASPWADRLAVVHSEVQSYNPTRTFDTIVCNPPFFVGGQKSTSPARRTARHDDFLPPGALMAAATRLLSDDGRLSVIVPADNDRAFVATARAEKLSVTRQRFVCPTPEHRAKRVLLEFSKSVNTACVNEPTLCIELQRHVYSPEYTMLARDFLMKMSS